MLTIMGGEWSGRKLAAPRSDSLRPTAGRVKAAIFSILESLRLKQGLPAQLDGCRVLDLFAGVGGLGLEALSRGAAQAVFVEKDRTHFQFLKKNVVSLGAESRSVLLLHAVDRVEAWKKYGPFDLVFLDPPYALEALPLLLKTLELAVVLTPGAIVVFEHDPRDKIEPDDRFLVHSERKLGPAGLSVFLHV